MFGQRGRNPTPVDLDGGEAEARLTRIYELHAHEVAAYILRRSAGSDAADAVAETFLVAWRRLDVVPAEPETLPWLYGVARRVMANQRRGNRRRTQLGDRLSTLFVHHAVDPPSLDKLEDFDQVIGALHQLNDDDAEMLRLTAWESLSPSEIATSLGISPAAARKRLQRARNRLKDQLASDGIEIDILGRSDPVWPADGGGPTNRNAPSSTNYFAAETEVAW